jgi:hypothetical protein
LFCIGGGGAEKWLSAASAAFPFASIFQDKNCTENIWWFHPVNHQIFTFENKQKT